MKKEIVDILGYINSDCGRPLLFVFIVVGMVGLISIIALKPLVHVSSLALGFHTISMFIPFGCISVVLIAAIALNRFNVQSAFLVIALFLFLTILFWDILFQPISHTCCNDSYWFSHYAHQILDKKSLSGNNGSIFHHQPGARYLLAGIITISGGENRLLQFVNMFTYLACMLVFLLATKNILERGQFKVIAIFFILALPYVAKNILMGLSEWMAVSLFFLCCSLLLSKKYYPAVLALALVPLFRQNLIFTSVLLFVFVMATRFRFALVALFIGVVLLPVYHNLVFVGELQWLSGGASADWSRYIAGIPQILIWKPLAYLGYSRGVSLDTTLLAILFVPFGTLLLMFFLFRLPRLNSLILFIFVISTIGATFFWPILSYFPRFQYVNQAIILSSISVIFFLLKNGRQREPAGSTAKSNQRLELNKTLVRSSWNSR